MNSVGAASVDQTSQETDNLQDNCVKGEDVRVANNHCRGNRALFPPSLVAHVDDEDEEGEEQGVGEEDGCKDRNAFRREAYIR